jgi:hypothetical protein
MPAKAFGKEFCLILRGDPDAVIPVRDSRAGTCFLEGKTYSGHMASMPEGILHEVIEHLPDEGIGEDGYVLVRNLKRNPFEIQLPCRTVDALPEIVPFWIPNTDIA